MKFKELKRSIAERVEPIYLVTGEDAFFLSHSVKLIIGDRVANPALNLSNFDGSEIKGNADKLLAALVS